MKINFKTKVLYCAAFALSLKGEESLRVLETMIVQGDASFNNVYQGASEAATRSASPLLEIPQSVRVLSQQQLKDIQTARVSDTFDYVSGVSKQNTFSNLWENYAVRGLTGDSNNAGLGYLLNGFAANRGFNAPRDSANVKSIEFLKGPSAALYGASDPGGTFNVTTKTPEWKPRYESTTLAGSNEFFRQELGATGPLNGSTAYRLDAAFEDGNSFRDFVGNQRSFIAPALTWKINDSTTLDYNGEYLRAENDFDRGVPFVNGKLGAVPISRFYGEPNDDPVELINIGNQLRMMHVLNSDWYLRAALAHKDNSLYGFSSETRNVQSNQLEMRRRYRLRDYDSQDWATQFELHGRMKVWGVEHQMLAGLDAYLFELDQILLNANYASHLKLANPVYGQSKPKFGKPLFDRTEEQKALGLLLQDQISITEQWKLLLGLRVENYQQELDDRVITRITEQNHTAVTPRLGLTWMAKEELSIYGSYSESFRPSLGTDSEFNTFDPEEGRAFELGIKYERKDKKLGASLALFDIRKENVLVNDPLDVNQTFLINGGKVGSRGLELDASGQVTDTFRVTAGLAYTDARILASPSQALKKGDGLLNVPDFSGSVLGIQEFDMKRMGRLGVGAGVVYTGDRNASQSKHFTLPAYTTVKALAYLQYNEHVRFFIDVDNIFDEEHYISSVNEFIVQPGNSRTVTFGVNMGF